MDTIDNYDEGTYGTDVTNNEISEIIDEIIQQSTIDNNNIGSNINNDNIDFTNLDDNKTVNYIYSTVFDRINDIIKKRPNIEHVLKNDKRVIAMINNNIPKKFAYTISFAQTILLILVMYNNLPKKNVDCSYSEDDYNDYDLPDVSVD